MDLYQKIDAVLKVLHQERIDGVNEYLAQQAEMSIINRQLNGTLSALNRLVEGLGSVLDVSFEEPKNQKKK